MWTLQPSGPPTLWASRAARLHLPALFRNAPNYNLKLPTFYFFPPACGCRNAYRCLRCVKWQGRDGWILFDFFCPLQLNPHISRGRGHTHGQLCYCESVSRMSVCPTHNITIIGGTSAEAQNYFDVFKNILKQLQNDPIQGSFLEDRSNKSGHILLSLQDTFIKDTNTH